MMTINKKMTVLAILLTTFIVLVVTTDIGFNLVGESCVQTLEINNQTFSSVQELEQTVNVPNGVKDTLSVTDNTVKIDTCMLENIDLRGDTQ